MCRVYIHVCAYACVRMVASLLHMRVCVCICVCVHTCVCTCVCMCVCMCVSVSKVEAEAARLRTAITQQGDAIRGMPVSVCVALGGKDEY